MRCVCIEIRVPSLGAARHGTASERALSIIRQDFREKRSIAWGLECLGGNRAEPGGCSMAEELDENLHCHQPHVPHFTVSIKTYENDVAKRGLQNDQ